MKSIISLLFLLPLCISLAAQKVKYYTVQPGENIQDVVPKYEAFEYPQFQTGVVIFRTGVRSSSRLNYNFLFEEMQFISPKADTLVINNPEEVESVKIGKDTYYYTSKRFVKLDTVIGDLKLGIAGFFTTVSKKKIGGYGETIEGTADSHLSLVVPTSGKFDLTPNFVTTIVRRRSAFISNKFNQFVPLTRKNIFSFYPEKEDKLKQYFNNHKVDLSSYSDVIALLTYMSKL